MKILHIVPLIQSSTGGPAVSVTRLASEQAKLGNEVTLACLDYPHLGPQVPAPGVRMVSVKGNVFAVHGRGWSPEFRCVLKDEAAKADVVHNHGLWMWPNAYAREAAVAARKPLVISPRGMLEFWSLNRSKLRKAVAWRLFEKKNLQSASLFHATAASEAESIRQAILPLRQFAKAESLERDVPIVVAANGVDLPNLDHLRPDRAVIEQRFPELKDRRWVVFMSRLHPKKGIDVLLRAWTRQKEVTSGIETPGHRGAVLVLAGPDLIGYRKEIEKMVQELGLGDLVVLTGEVQGEMKDALLANADVFVLPSYSENFGIVVAEGMAWGRPVIASTGTPWKELADVGAGWWVSPRGDALAKALAEALGKRTEELGAMGTKGRALVAEKYGWSAPAQRLTAAYEQLTAN